LRKSLLTPSRDRLDGSDQGARSARCDAQRLDDNCGGEGWAMAPAGTVGVVNDAIAFYFADAAFAQAFVARFCCGYRVETIAGAFAARNDAPTPRRTAAAHKTP
jgi:hypothetical protein